jgi:hypothetical protein
MELLSDFDIFLSEIRPTEKQRADKSPHALRQRILRPLPLIAGYAYHKGGWKNRKGRRLARGLD